MMEKTYKFAGRVVRIDSVYEQIHIQCREYRSDEAPQYTIQIDESDIRNERSRAEQDVAESGESKTRSSDAYIETLAVYRKLAELLIPQGIILFHGSAIAVDGEAYLFTAKSGTGKSTHTRLWRELFSERAVMVNDDKPLLEVTESGVIVHGTPWDGKHHLSTNISVPLRAVCVISRDTENHIEKVSGKDVYPMLLQQMYRSKNPENMMKSLEILDRIVQNVAFYRLGCNMNPEAAIVAADEMMKK